MLLSSIVTLLWVVALILCDCLFVNERHDLQGVLTFVLMAVGGWISLQSSFFNVLSALLLLLMLRREYVEGTFKASRIWRTRSSRKTGRGGRRRTRRVPSSGDEPPPLMRRLSSDNVELDPFDDVIDDVGGENEELFD